MIIFFLSPIGSIVGFNGNIGQTIYSTSKSGLVGFTKSLAKELGPKNITANLICPGETKLNNLVYIYNIDLQYELF